MMTMMVMMIWSVVNLRQYGIHEISGGSASQCSLAKYARRLLPMLCFFLSYRLFMGIVVLVETHYWNDLFKISYFIKVSARLKLRAHYWSKMGWPVVQMHLPPPISLVLHKKIEQPNLMKRIWSFVQNINSTGKQNKYEDKLSFWNNLWCEPTCWKVSLMAIVRTVSWCTKDPGWNTDEPKIRKMIITIMSDGWYWNFMWREIHCGYIRVCGKPNYPKWANWAIVTFSITF